MWILPNLGLNSLCFIHFKTFQVNPNDRTCSKGSMDPVRAFPSVHGVCEMFAADHTNLTLFDFKKQCALVDFIFKKMSNTSWPYLEKRDTKCWAVSSNRWNSQTAFAVSRAFSAAFSAGEDKCKPSYGSWQPLKRSCRLYGPTHLPKNAQNCNRRAKGTVKNMGLSETRYPKNWSVSRFPLWTCYFRATPHFQANPPQKKHSSGEVSTASVQIIST